MGASSDWAIREGNRNKAGEALEILNEIGLELKIGYPVSEQLIKKYDRATALVRECKNEREENSALSLK